MDATEEEIPPVPTAVEIRRSAYDNRTAFVLPTCCADCLKSCCTGALQLLQTVTDSALPCMFLAALPTLACWIIGGIIGIVENDLTAFYFSAMGFLVWGFSWITLVAVIVLEKDEHRQASLLISANAKLAYFVYGLTRVALSVTGIVKLTSACTFESECPTEQVIRAIGYACIFLDPYLLVALAKWPEYYAKDEGRNFLVVLVLKHAIFTLPWALAGVGGFMLLSVLFVGGISFFCALLVVHLCPFVFYISGLIALITEEPEAAIIAASTFLMLSCSYWPVFIALLHDSKAGEFLPWLTKVGEYLGGWPTWAKALVSVLLFARCAGAITTVVIYVNPYWFGLTNKDIAGGLRTAAITFGILDPLIICGVVFGSGYVKCIRNVVNRYNEEQLPVAAQIAPSI